VTLVTSHDGNWTERENTSVAWQTEQKLTHRKPWNSLNCVFVPWQTHVWVRWRA
jgi:hypothetical protein